jgi:hypothetical protein
VVVFIGDNKYSDTAGQRRSHPFAKEEGGRGRDGYFEGDVRVPAFISGGFVETSLLAADTALYRYVYSTMLCTQNAYAHKSSDFSPFYNYNVSIYINKFPHISLIKITNMYIVSVTHYVYTRSRSLVHVTDLYATILNLPSSSQSGVGDGIATSSFKTVTHTSATGTEADIYNEGIAVGVGVDQWRYLIGGGRKSNTMVPVPREVLVISDHDGKVIWSQLVACLTESHIFHIIVFTYITPLIYTCPFMIYFYILIQLTRRRRVVAPR